MNKFKLLGASALVTSVIGVQTFASPVVELIPTKVQQDAIMKEMRASDKFSFTPDEVANYLDRSTPSSSMKPAVPTFKTHVNNQIIEKNESGEVSCFAAFGDNEIMKKMQQLMELLNNMDPSLSLPTTDAVMAIMSELTNKMWEAAKEGVCGQLTQEAAKKLVDEIMNKKLGYDIDDIKTFDKDKYAKQQAKSYLNSEDVDERVFNSDQWGNMFD